MKLATINKQPAEKFSYTVDYSDALTLGDNLESASVVVTPSGLTISNVGVYDPRVKLWIADGLDKETYKVTLTVLTTDGRTFQDELVFKIKDI